MLVLDRKVQEGFWIDGRIFVKVLGIGRRRVKLGISAPSELQVVRDELWSNAPSQNSTKPGPGGTEDGAQTEGSFRAMRRRN